MTEQPKKPGTPFFQWMNSNRATLTKEVGTAPGAVAKLASQKWNALSDAQKKPFVDKAEKAKIEYDKAMEAFKAAGGEVSKRKRKGKENQGGNRKLRKIEGCPKKPTGGGYGQFLAEVRAELTEKFPPGPGRFTQVTKAAGEKWKALPETKKEHYNKLYLEKQKVYQVEFDKFMKEHGDKVGKNDKDSDDGEDESEDEDDEE